METLYDLLGALPRDDAEGLRAAFRRSVKGAHPDLNPGDPNAGLKFRQIVRANEILADVEQRAAYDHLLELARLEQKQLSGHALADAIYRGASAVMALAAASVLTVGAYLLFMMSATSVPPARQAGLAGSTPAAIPAPMPAKQGQAVANAPSAPPATPELTEVPAGVTPPTDPAPTAPAHVGPPLDLTPNDAGLYRRLGIAAYRSGDLDSAVADFDLAIQLDPKFAAAYIDRSIVLYRMRKLNQALADVARAKRLERASRTAALQANAKKQRPARAGDELPARPASPRRAAEVDLSH